MKTLTPAQQKAYQNLNIDTSHRVILSLDGGGVRGILTLQLLKKIEEIAGIPCYQFCDMVAGTSTGAIIAGLIAFGKTAAEIEQLYIQFVTKVFIRKSLLANRFINPPAYDKKNYREALKSVLGDITLEQTNRKTGVDMMITAKDVTDNEETFFNCFEVNGEIKNVFKDALLRTVMEATMSAPTYFSPLERFIDGGTTTYNNPSLAALLEAICYSGKGKYQADKITMFSLGTGTKVLSVTPDQAASPTGPDAYFWLNYVMDESGQDASSMQTDVFRSPLLQLNYRRFQISLNCEAMQLLPDNDISGIHAVNANRISGLTKEDLNGISMDDVSKFDLLKAIGQAMTDYIMKENKFTKDLNNTPTHRDELVTAFYGVKKIQPLISQAGWVNGLPS
ncbi:patatin-like phospholipase family protein [Mucilaginibacter arboris]|uniref:PNPLA domain-containing protein n=1 Tax=Mucilaginibacter arboris TaxID=2682090 RepID=A0A7K1SYR2_9SPHI|nr:patatin-like phospholipase family protein [Mucilaginibacter arboris]MVN22452.1 hypothetical protein [Mucilaginibacter arboris]